MMVNSREHFKFNILDERGSKKHRTSGEGGGKKSSIAATEQPNGTGMKVIPPQEKHSTIL